MKQKELAKAFLTVIECSLGFRAVLKALEDAKAHEEIDDADFNDLIHEAKHCLQVTEQLGNGCSLVLK